ncbi:MAG: hypothetical protein JWN95_2274 [Frankiales bacterium]|nr:hypothetical protein [Frankiales bacterium]
MPRELSDEILSVLKATPSDRGPVSLAHLSRLFGVSSKIVSSCATEMVGRGLAEPSMIMAQGTQRIHGLLPQAAVKVTT